MRHLRLLLRRASGALCAVALVTAVGASAQSRPERTLQIRVVGAGVVTSQPPRTPCSASCSYRFRPGAMAELRATPRRFFSFDHWRGGCVGSARQCLLALDRSAEVRAIFRRQSATVRITVGGPGTLVSDPPGINCGVRARVCEANFDKGTTVELRPGADSELPVVAAWGGACSGEPQRSCRLRVDGDRSALAAFGHEIWSTERQILTVRIIGFGSVVSEPPGIDCPPSCSALFPSGTVVALHNPSQGEGVLYRWSGACVGQQLPCLVVVDAATEVEAESVFLSRPPIYGINVSVSGRGTVYGGGGIKCGGTFGTLLDCEGQFRAGSSVVLRAQPGRHSRFARWSGFCQGRRNRCVLRVTAPKIAIALFRR